MAELLKDGLFVDGDWVESKDQDPDGDVRLIQLSDIGDGSFLDKSARFLTSKRAKELGCTFLEPGDVLVARMPEPLGRACMFPGVDQPAVTAVDVCIMRPNSEVARPQWLVRAINAPGFRAAMNQFIRGTTRQRISRRNLGRMQLDLPDPEEQDAIVENLQRIEKESAGIRDGAHAGLLLLERLERSVLAAACSGRLTTDWRENHQLDPAKVPSERLESLPKKRLQAVRGFSSESLQTLPSTWIWVPLAAVGDSVLGKMLDRQKNKGSLQPYLRNINVRWRRFDLSDVHEMRFEPGEDERFGLRSGDVLVCEGGHPGRAAVWLEEKSNMRFQKAVHRVRCEEELSPEWLVNVLQAHATSGVLKGYYTGTGIAHLTGVSLARVAIPLPPIDEQLEINRRVRLAFETADQVDRHLRAALDRFQDLMKSIMSKAFEGELAAA